LSLGLTLRTGFVFRGIAGMSDVSVSTLTGGQSSSAVGKSMSATIQSVQRQACQLRRDVDALRRLHRLSVDAMMTSLADVFHKLQVDAARDFLSCAT